MAKKKKKFNWQESYASLVLGAIVVVILGLLVANYFTRKNSQELSPLPSGEEIQQEVSFGEYKTVSGDSLSKISEKFYGSYDYWPVLAKANNIVNANLLYTDITIRIPSKSEADSIKTILTSSAYQVQEGDTLFAIAEKVYGDGFKWPILHQANGSLRLPNGNPLIYAGSTIIIPR